MSTESVRSAALGYAEAGSPTTEGRVAGRDLPVRTPDVVGWLTAPHVPPTDTQARFDAWKRLLEFLIALVAIIVLAPLLVVVALLAGLSSRSTPLFVQERIGRDGIPFPCLKYRSMYSDADARLEQLLADPVIADEWERNHKLRHDPRVTRVGRFLRSTNLDELPQLFNILFGHMSLVGPRPIVFAEVPKYGPALRQVLIVRPGLTGLWQVSGRNSLPYPERVRLDLEYVDARSAGLDLVICAKTASQMTSGLLGSRDQGAW